jgi:hypothetical protein
MYKRIDFTQLEGLGFTQDTLDFLQASYRDSFAGLAAFLGDFVIVTGVIDEGATYSNGWVAINGQLLPFAGGLKASRIIVDEVVTTELFEDGSTKNVYYVRTAKLASSGGTLFTSFVRLSTVKQIISDLANANANANGRVSKGGDTMTGALVMSNQKITSLQNGTIASDAINKGQLDALKNELLNGAGAAFDTLQELATALGNDPNFATTMANALNGKVAKAGDTITGALTVQGGINTDNVTTKKKKIATGDWNMSALIFKTVPHGLDFTKIIGVEVTIRNDSNTARFQLVGVDWNATEISIPNSGYGSLPEFDGTGFSRGTVIVEYEV